MLRADEFTTEFTLEAGEWELTLCGARMATDVIGSAELMDDGEGWFFVSSITFGTLGGKLLPINGRSDNWALDSMFKELAGRIEASLAAKDWWENAKGNCSQKRRAAA